MTKRKQHFFENFVRPGLAVRRGATADPELLTYLLVRRTGDLHREGDAEFRIQSAQKFRTVTRHEVGIDALNIICGSVSLIRIKDAWEKMWQRQPEDPVELPDRERHGKRCRNPMKNLAKVGSREHHRSSVADRRLSLWNRADRMCRSSQLSKSRRAILHLGASQTEHGVLVTSSRLEWRPAEQRPGTIKQVVHDRARSSARQPTSDLAHQKPAKVVDGRSDRQHELHLAIA